MVKLKIDNYDVEVPAGTSILDAARTVQIEIPTLCKHPDVDPSAGCGMCIVRDQRQGYAFLLYAGRRRYGGHNFRSGTG